MAQELSQYFFSVVIFIHFSITIMGEVYRLLPVPKLNDTCMANDCDCLTFAQFASNSSNYLTNTTTLIFTPGRHTIEVELAIKNIHSFSMLTETNPFTPTEIVCYDHAKFTFSNVSTVNVSGFRFSGCTGNHILSVGQFHLKKSTFYGHDGVNVSGCGTTWTVARTVSYLESVSFMIHYYSTEQLAHNYVRFMDTCPGAILHFDASIVAIKRSLFVGNQWRILYGKCGSNISISSSTFASNEAFHGGVINVTSGSAISISTCTFKKCKGDILKAVDAFVIIKHSFFLNTLISSDVMIYSAPTTSHNYYNNSQLLSTRNTSLSVNHSEFVGNANDIIIILFLSGGNIHIHHCQFFRTIASTTLCLIQNADELSITHNEFRNNNVAQGILYIYDSTGMPITSNNDFVNNNAVFDI